MRKDFAQAVADGLNELGWQPDVPNKHNEFEFEPGCHEVQTIISKINEVVESWPFVYSKLGEDFHKWHFVNFTDSTHKARLAFVEEIPKKECKHEPKFWSVNGRIGAYEPNCYKCGAELKLEWKTK